MKIIYLECTEGELRANRGIMDNVVDMVSGMAQAFYGTCTMPKNSKDEEDEPDDDRED